MAAAPKKAEEANPENEAPKSGKKKLFLMVGLALLLVVVSVGGTVVALKMFGSEDDKTAEEEPVEEKHLAPAIYYTMTPNFTINFNVNGRQRYLQAEITLMYRDESLEPSLKLHMPAIRNGLVMLLSGKNFDELQTSEGKEKLRADALETIRSILKKERDLLQAADEEDEDDEEEAPAPEVEEVLFTNFVMQ